MSSSRSGRSVEMRASSSQGRATPSQAGSPSWARVNVVPPWARHEPPSPPDSPMVSPIVRPSSTNNNNVPSLALSPVPTSASGDYPAYLTGGPNNETSWWTFVTRTRPRPHPSPSPNREPDALPLKPRIPRSLTWFPRASVGRSFTSPLAQAANPFVTPSATSNALQTSAQTPTSPRPPPLPRAASLHLDLSHPISPILPSRTLRQAQTPGWESPWRPGRAGVVSEEGDYGWDDRRANEESAAAEKGWKKRRKRFRNFCLYHSATPLLFRLLNLTFTTSALALAIHIRLLEKAASEEGVTGSSPAVVIVFAPFTLVHVMFAIYLEYFGRPLGLWRTSAKLTHTLLEVVFVCLWSSALSLAIDNYLTTPLRCAPRYHTQWWNGVQSQEDPVSVAGGRVVCRDQLALIFLVLVGLWSYIANLVISLFRIFEKVKFRRADQRLGIS